MAFAKPLRNLSQISELPKDASPNVIRILNSIFLEDQKSPTISDLCNDSYFNVTLSGYNRPPAAVFDKQTQLLLAPTKEKIGQLDGIYVATSPKPQKRKISNDNISSGWQPGPNAVIPSKPRIKEPEDYSKRVAPIAATNSNPNLNSPTTAQTTNSNNSTPSQTPRAVAPTTTPNQQTQASQTQQKAPQTQSTAPQGSKSTAPPGPTSKPPGPTTKPPKPTTVEIPEKDGQNELLDSIQQFASSKLKKTVTNDRSAPKF